MIGGNKITLISEVGWRGMKDLSSLLLKDGLLVDIIIKGNINREILEIITKPTGLTIRAIPKRFFRLYLFSYLLWHKMMRDLKTVVVNKEKTKNLVKAFGFQTKVLIETKEGYSLR